MSLDIITNNAAGTGTNTLYSTTVGGFSGSSYGGTIKDGATAKVALAVGRGRFILSGNNTFSGGVDLFAGHGTSVLGIADMRSAGTAGSRNLTFSGTTNKSRLQVYGTGITSLSGFNSVPSSSTLGILRSSVWFLPTRTPSLKIAMPPRLAVSPFTTARITPSRVSCGMAAPAPLPCSKPAAARSPSPTSMPTPATRR